MTTQAPKSHVDERQVSEYIHAFEPDVPTTTTTDTDTARPGAYAVRVTDDVDVRALCTLAKAFGKTDGSGHYNFDAIRLRYKGHKLAATVTDGCVMMTREVDTRIDGLPEESPDPVGEFFTTAADLGAARPLKSSAAHLAIHHADGPGTSATSATLKEWKPRGGNLRRDFEAPEHGAFPAVDQLWRSSEKDAPEEGVKLSTHHLRRILAAAGEDEAITLHIPTCPRTPVVVRGWSTPGDPSGFSAVLAPIFVPK